MQLSAPTDTGATVARMSIASGLALVAAMFPYAAPAIAFATPAVLAFLERSIKRPSRIIEEAFRRGELLDLSDDQLVGFLPMAYRIFLAAQQGEYDHNLRLLAIFMTSEIKLNVCEPGSLLGMARRLEGLDTDGLRTVALIGEWIHLNKSEVKGDRISITAALLANNAFFAQPLSYSCAADALADLAGRGFLYPDGSASIGKTEEFYHPTAALHNLLTKATALAEEGVSTI